MKSKEPYAWFDNTSPEWEDQYFDDGLRGRMVRKRMLLALEYIAEEKLPPGSKILDLGCGPGIIAGELSKSGYRVTCMDFSSRLLLRARDRQKGCSYKLPTFVRADAHALPFQKGAFDAIVCIGVISWVLDPYRTLHEIARVLRPGGILIITSINKYSVENLFDPLFWWRRFVPPAMRASARTLLKRSANMQGKEPDLQPQQFPLRCFNMMLNTAGLTITNWRTVKYGHFRLFGRRIFPVRVEVAIDRALERIWWVPMIRCLGWLYLAKAKRAAI